MGPRCGRARVAQGGGLGCSAGPEADEPPDTVRKGPPLRPWARNSTHWAALTVPLTYTSRARPPGSPAPKCRSFHLALVTDGPKYSVNQRRSKRPASPDPASPTTLFSTVPHRNETLPVNHGIEITVRPRKRSTAGHSPWPNVGGGLKLLLKLPFFQPGRSGGEDVPPLEDMKPARLGLRFPSMDDDAASLLSSTSDYVPPGVRRPSMEDGTLPAPERAFGPPTRSAALSPLKPRRTRPESRKPKPT